MDRKKLQKIGKTTGIAGVALGVVITIFREFIRKDIGVSLSSDQAFAIYYLLIMLTFGIGCLGLVAWLISEQTGPGKPINQRSMGLLAGLIVVFIFATIWMKPQQVPIPSPEPPPPQPPAKIELSKTEFTFPDIAGLDGNSNHVSTVGKISVVVIEDPASLPGKQDRVVVNFGFYNGSGTWRGSQALVLQLLSESGATLKQFSIPLDRGKCIYGGLEMKNFEAPIDDHMKSLIKRIDMSVTRVSGVQTRC